MGFAYKKLNLQDVSTEQYTTNKGYSSSLDRLLEDGYTVLFGQRPVSGVLFDPINSPKNPDGSYRELVYSGIKHLYYYNYITGSLTGSFFRSSSYDNFDQTTLVSGNLDTVIKQFPLVGGRRDLYDSMSFYDTDAIYDGENAANLLVLDFDKEKFGSGVNPGSFKISSSQFLVKDDGLGNLYAYTGSLIQALYSDPDSEYNGVVYGPNSSSLPPLSDETPHKTYIGNIVYSHGVAIITHPEFLCILGSSPVAINDNVEILNVSCSKVLDLLKNDFDDCYNIDPSTLVFHDTESWPFNYAVDNNGFITLTPDELSTTPGSYSLGYTVRNELGRTSNSASYNLILTQQELTGSLIEIENICQPDQADQYQQIQDISYPTGSVTFSIDFGVPYYSWSNDGINYIPVPDLCQPIVSGTVSASFDGTIYIKDREETIFELPYVNSWPIINLDITTQSVGWCVNNPFIFPSPSPTPSITPSRTPSRSVSATPSKTPSISPSQNNSPSRTPSITPTRTRTVSPSITRTPSRTPSITPSTICENYGTGLNRLNSSNCTDVYFGVVTRHNSPDWYNSSIFKSAFGCTTMPSGWYTDTFIVRYWDSISGWAGGSAQLCSLGGGGGFE